MFPIPFNFPFRKKDGSISTIGDEITNGGSGGGSSYVLPTASAEVKGGVKIGAGLTMEGEVLKNTNPTPATPYVLPIASANALGGVKIGNGVNIDENGVISVSGGSDDNIGVYGSLTTVRPVFKTSETDNTKYSIAITDASINSPTTVTFSSNNYDFDEVYDPSLSFEAYEFFSYVTSKFLTDSGAVLLSDHKGANANSGTLSDSFNNYDAIIIQGGYDTTGQSNYDTTMIYLNPILNTSYWFGVKDRNSSYSSYIRFTDSTSFEVTAARKFQIYGIPKAV